MADNDASRKPGEETLELPLSKRPSARTASGVDDRLVVGRHRDQRVGVGADSAAKCLANRERFTRDRAGQVPLLAVLSRPVLGVDPEDIVPDVDGTPSLVAGVSEEEVCRSLVCLFGVECQRWVSDQVGRPSSECSLSTGRHRCDGSVPFGPFGGEPLSHRV